MEIKVDVGIAHLSKRGEEVCGDTSQVINTGDSTIIILSDGLGSGIKASILSILSSRIAARLIESNIDLEQVFATIADTLPICKVRGLAYSTLSILQISEDGNAHLIEYDNPSLVLIRNDEMISFKKNKKIIAGKEIYEAFFQVELGDILLMVSDGVINAGVGGLFKLGLGRERLLENIFKRNLYKEEAQKLARDVIGLTRACYLEKPGDDSTSIVVKTRKPRRAVVLTGPPREKNLDREVVSRFKNCEGCMKIICGGATGNMVAREIGEEIKTSLDYFDSSVPPTAVITGVDLVTEGILTLNKCLDKISIIDFKDLNTDKTDAATMLAANLLRADKICFMMGTAINPAHEELMRSLQLKPRSKVIGQLIKKLRSMGKKVEIEVF